MSHSKATAALLRLKEIDKKYRITQVRKEQTTDPVSKENFMDSSSSTQEVPVIRSSYNLKDSDTAKPRLEIQMPETYVEYTEKNIFTNGKKLSTVGNIVHDRNLKNTSNESSRISESAASQSDHLKERLEAGNKTEEKSNNSLSEMKSPNLKKDTEEVTSDISTNEEIFTASADINTSSSHSIHVKKDKNSRVIKTKDRLKSETQKVEAMREGFTSLAKNSETNKHVKTVRSESKVNDENEGNLGIHGKSDFSKEGEKESSANYTNDTFNESSSSAILTIDNDQSQSDVLSAKSETTEKTESVSSNEPTMFGVKKVDITPRAQRATVSEMISKTDEKKLIEIISPRAIERTSDYEVDLDKDLTDFARKVESGEVIEPVSLLPTAKDGARVKKHRRKHGATRGSRDVALSDDNSRSGKEGSKSGSVSETDDRKITKIARSKKSTGSSQSSTVSNSGQTSTTQKTGKNSSRNAKSRQMAGETSREIKSRRSTPRSEISTSESLRSDKKLEELDSVSGSQEMSDENLSPSRVDHVSSPRTLSRLEKVETCDLSEPTNTPRKTVENNVTSPRVVVNKENSVVEESSNDDDVLSTKERGDVKGKHVPNLLLRDHQSQDTDDARQRLVDKLDVVSVLRKLNSDALEAVTKRYKTSGQQLPKEQFVKHAAHACTCAQKKSPCTKVGEKSVDLKKITNTTHSGRRRKTKKKSKCLHKGICCSKKDDEHLGPDRKQMHRSRKRVITHKSQQERKNLLRYSSILENSRPKVARGGQTFIKPLDFPKIESFVRPDNIDEELRLDEHRLALYERVLAIRQWLKDRLHQYKDRSKLARTVNAGYVPTTLEDTKKIIRELRREMYEMR